MSRIKRGKIIVLTVMLLSLCGCGGQKYPDYFQKIVDAHEQGIETGRDDGLQRSYEETYSKDTINAYADTVPRPKLGEFNYYLNWLKTEDGTVLENISVDLKPYMQDAQNGECGTGGVFYEDKKVFIAISVSEWELPNECIVDKTLLLEFSTENPDEYVVTEFNISSSFECPYRVADKLCFRNGAGTPIYQIDMETKEVYDCSRELETAKEYAESMSEKFGKEVSLYWLSAKDYVDGVMVYSGTVQEEMDSENLASIYLAYEGETLVGVLMIDSATGEITYITPEDVTE